ncbi:MAG: NAD-dependent epimerase/dehydratase family protein, partial [Bacteroidota bacterium]|nr:NAD-dependent epimerase/dehydratase family protein [Bacteroidota bacterium]
MENRKALVIGATGLIGRSLVFELLKSEAYSEVIVLTRRDLVIKHSKL